MVSSAYICIGTLAGSFLGAGARSPRCGRPGLRVLLTQLLPHVHSVLPDGTKSQASLNRSSFLLSLRPRKRCISSLRSELETSARSIRARWYRASSSRAWLLGAGTSRLDSGKFDIFLRGC